MNRAFKWALIGVGTLALLGALATALTPWPRALVYRHAFNAGGAQAADAMRRHVPPGVASRLDLAYRPGDPDARLDVFRPASADGPLPVVVWIHGGAFISGRKEDVAPYLQILASHGYAAVGIEYSIAPGAHYPEPIRQANDALAWLRANAGPLGLDMRRVALAGDSAGGHAAAQLAQLSVSPEYARVLGITPALDPGHLRAAVLACGVYDLTLPDYDGEYGRFLRTVLWAYFGRQDFLEHPHTDFASVAQHVDGRFPPSFVTAGNGDPLLPQSVAMAGRLQTAGVATDTLFFPADHSPALPHEYQFNLDTREGQQALSRLLAFLDRHLR
ncbi:MAG: hypothetical protein A2579_14050 [Lysobacterales bacterium RIFOXYD1_FULL_69_11]|nr:MAG: hypothetical protein A2579_14050 [Xanthomonadales bacterium RIFOXYD1_FULL_69_11]